MNDVHLKPKRDVPVRAGHPWVFSQAVAQTDARTPGEQVRVIAADGTILGIGLFNPHNSIRVRMIAREECTINRAFFSERLRALNQRKRMYLPSGTTGYRVVHGDADGMPGLIVDRYNDVVVFQIHTHGMDLLRACVIDALHDVCAPKAIVERSDIEARKREGLIVLPVTVHAGTCEQPVLFQENGFHFLADVLEGQKTGFYLDQRDGRSLLTRYAAGKRVLNLFSYSGAASVYAAGAGAQDVVSVDSSPKALALAERHYELNQSPQNVRGGLRCIQANVFEFLGSADRKRETWDVIVCDPPAFMKSDDRRTSALKAYSDLNAACLMRLSKGGLLLTSSCSGRLTAEDFRDTIRIAAGYARKSIAVLSSLGQPFDHTDIIAFPEGRYLKTLLVEVV